VYNQKKVKTTTQIERKNILTRNEDEKNGTHRQYENIKECNMIKP